MYLKNVNFVEGSADKVVSAVYFWCTLEKGDKFTINLVKKTSAVTALLACLGSILIFFFNNQSIQQTYVAISACVALCSLALYIHIFPNNRHNGLIFMLVVMLAIMLPMSLSGGVHSRFIVMIPVLPMMMFLILNRKVSYVLTTVLIVFIISIAAFESYLIDLTGKTLLVRETFPRTLWLVIATLFSLSFTIVFADINSKLTMQLQASAPHQNNLKVNTKETAFRYASNLLLKLTSHSSKEKYLSVFVVEPYILASDAELDEIQSNRVASCLHKVFKNEADIIGQLEPNLYMVCQPLFNKENARDRAEKMQQNLRNSDLNLYIGYIVIDANVGIDIQSIVSLARMALARAKKHSIPHIIDYSELKTLS